MLNPLVSCSELHRPLPFRSPYAALPVALIRDLCPLGDIAHLVVDLLPLRFFRTPHASLF